MGLVGDRGQRIGGTGTGVSAASLAGDLQPLGDVPDCEPPVLVAAEPTDLGQGVLMLVALQPLVGETCGDVLQELLGK